MGAVVVIVLVIVAGTAYTIYNTVVARQQIQITVSGRRHEVLARVNAYFGRTWARVDGPGDVNVRPSMRIDPATLSIDVVEEFGDRCRVSIWTSAWTTRYGLMGHAQLARRKKNGLAASLSRQAAVDPGSRPAAA